MGQYYKAFFIDDEGNEKIMSPPKYDTGYKLMEHSWFGNDFVNVVIQNIVENPLRLAWLGDYSDGLQDPDYNFGDGFVENKETFLQYYDSAWGDDYDIDDEVASTSEPLINNGECDYFVVNETKGCYIDMTRYVTNNSKNRWCIHPIPLLTSVGNGRGGGDYFGDDPHDDVGSWAFDKIYISYLKPAGMEEVVFHFAE